jgi:hypothetical protein
MKVRVTGVCIEDGRLLVLHQDTDGRAAGRCLVERSRTEKRCPRR